MPTPSCSRSAAAVVQRQLTVIDEDYSRAFAASASASDDIKITTSIGTTWGAFRFSIGRPCEAVASMQAVFESFSNSSLSGPVLLQTLNMIVDCVQRSGTYGTAITSWMSPEETRQVSAMGFVLDLLDKLI